MTNSAYICGFCGKPHDQISERMKCENNCYEQQEKAKEQQKQEEFIKMQKEDFIKLSEARDIYLNLINECVQKYGVVKLPIGKLEDSINLHNLFRSLRL